MKRQRVLFLKENYVLRVLKNFMMAGLFIIALLLILVHKVDLGVISGISKSVFFVTTPLMHAITLPAEGVAYSYKKASEIVNVYQENERLKEENEELFLLKDQMRAIKAENAILKKLLYHFDFPDIKSRTARVIAETGNAFVNSLILYLGDDVHDIKSGYPVLSDKGLIGRIELVSGKYARVTLVTDMNSKIPVVSQKSRDRGILVGTNSREMKLMFTPLLAELYQGDLLVTSGMGGGVPPGLPVARVQKNETEEITAVPLFEPADVEIVKILLYDEAPSEAVLKGLE